jgi:hypothetical protein
MFSRRFFSLTRYVHPHCAACVNYKKAPNDAYSVCKKFTFVNMKTDELEYEYADYARRSESKCGYSGKLYEAKSLFKDGNENR